MSKTNGIIRRILYNNAGFRAVPLLFVLLLCCSACAEGFFFGDMPEYLMATPTPEATPAPTVYLPEDVSANKVYGLACNPVEAFLPHSDRGRYNRALIRLCYESLYSPDEDFTPRPLLCERMETNDNRSFRLYLRGGTRFWDGSLLTEADVAYSFALAALGLYAERFDGMLMRMDDTGALLLESETAVYNIAALLDFPVCKRDSGLNDTAVGTGAYQWRIENGDAYLLRNPYHADADSVRERIELLPVTGDRTVGYWFGNGSLRSISLDLLDPLSPGLGSRYERTDYLTGEFCFIVFNHTAWLTKDAAFRRVCALAFDRQTLSETAFGALATPTSLPQPPASPYEPEDMRTAACDPAKAAAELAALGFEDRDGDGILDCFEKEMTTALQLTLLCAAGNPAHVKLAEGYAEALRALGLDVLVAARSDTAYAEALASGDYDLAVAQSLLAPNFDPGVFLEKGAALSLGYDGGPAMQTRIDTLREAPASERKTALRAVYRQMADDAALLPVCFRLHSVCEAYEELSP